MDFLITNMTGFRNKGCEATTKAIVNEKTKFQNDAKLKIFHRRLRLRCFLDPSESTLNY